MNGPAYLAAGGGSQGLSGSLIQQPIVPSGLTAGEASVLLLPLIFFFSVPQWCCMLLLSDSQTAQIPKHCRAAYV